MNRKFYYCYSIKQFHYLKAEGFKYELTETHKETGNRFWKYRITESLSFALKKWTDSKPKEIEKD